MIEYKVHHKASAGGRRSRGRRTVRRKTPSGKGRSPIPVRRILLAAGGLLAVALVTASGAAVYAFLGHSPVFAVREIEMTPCANITRDEVWGALRGAPQGNIWRLSSEQIGRRLEGNPWVREVSVRKVFPDRLVVNVVERKAVAMVNLDALCYVDEDGTVFKRLTAYDPKTLPVLTGFRAQDLKARDAVALQGFRKGLELLRTAEAGVLKRNVSEVHFDVLEGYTIVTRDAGIQFKLGNIAFPEAMRRIEEVLPTLANLSRVAVDLKTKGRVFVKTGG